MVINEKKLLNILFSLFVLSTMIMSSSVIGKAFQLLFVGMSLLLTIRRTLKITKYNIFEWAFVLYVLIQVISGIAELPDHTLDMAVTLIYAALFSIAFYNYASFINDPYEIVKVYANTTIIAFFIAIIVYNNSLLSFRLSTSSLITFGGVTLFGGSSSTALAMQAAIPAFFVALFPPDKSRKKANAYIVLLLFFALITGTRKVLVIFAYVLFFVNELLKGEQRNFKLLKAMFITLIALLVCYAALMNIPPLYNLIGYRVEDAVIYYLQGESDEASIRGRERMLREALNLYKERKIFGWGMDYYKYGENTTLGYYSHNNFLEMLSGGGIVGFFIYYARYIYLAFKIIRSKGERNSKIALLGMLIIMTILEYWQVTYFYRYIIITQVLMLYIIEYKGRYLSGGNKIERKNKTVWKKMYRTHEM